MRFNGLLHFASLNSQDHFFVSLQADARARALYPPEIYP